MKESWPQYSAAAAFGKTFALLLVGMQALAGDAGLELATGPGRLAGLSWDEVHMHYRLSEASERDWRLAIKGLLLNDQLPALDLRMHCPVFRWGEYGPDCAAARLLVSVDGMESFELSDLRIRSGPDQSVQVLWDGALGRVELYWQAAAEVPALGLNLEDLDLALIPPALLSDFGLDVLEGRVTADLRLQDDAISGTARWSDGGLDGFGGLVAAEGLALELDLNLATDGAAARVMLRQVAGELLLGSIYLPPPAAALELLLDLQRLPGAEGPEQIKIRRFSLTDPGSLVAAGAAELTRDEETWVPSALVLDELQVLLPAFWARWMDGPAASAGFGGLALSGEIAGRLSWRSGALPAVELLLDGVSVHDPRERFALSVLQAQVDGDGASIRADLAWGAAGLGGLPLGASALAVHADELGLRLLDPFRVPMLDGAIAVDSLAWLNLPELPSRLVLDARIEPVSLSLLTRELGLIELGGTLAGRFPGVQYQEERLIFAGGIVMDAFSGQIMVDDLEIERPFGSLPALAAHVEFQRLDLLELTGAFDFGRMEGQMSGWVRELRLLDWRPVAMDARLFTHEDVPRRRISQRAVDNLTSLGGAGGALLSGTILRVFDDFPYRRAGLACRLSNNICHLDGVARHESGGFIIVEGRGLPRLDVVGHRRLVDWPELLRQLEAIRGEPD